MPVPRFVEAVVHDRLRPVGGALDVDDRHVGSRADPTAVVVPFEDRRAGEKIAHGRVADGFAQGSRVGTRDGAAAEHRIERRRLRSGDVARRRLPCNVDVRELADAETGHEVDEIPRCAAAFLVYVRIHHGRRGRCLGLRPLADDAVADDAARGDRPRAIDVVRFQVLDERFHDVVEEREERDGARGRRAVGPEAAAHEQRVEQRLAVEAHVVHGRRDRRLPRGVARRARVHDGRVTGVLPAADWKAIRTVITDQRTIAVPLAGQRHIALTTEDQPLRPAMAEDDVRG